MNCLADIQDRCLFFVKISNINEHLMYDLFTYIIQKVYDVLMHIFRMISNSFATIGSNRFCFIYKSGGKYSMLHIITNTSVSQ